MLYGIIISIIVLISILLIVVILLQPGQKEGLSGGLAAGMMGSSGMGARRTADLLSTTTAVLATAFLLLSLLANFAIDAGGSPDSSTIQERGLNQPTQQAPADNDFDLPSESESPIPQQPAEDEDPEN